MPFPADAFSLSWPSGCDTSELPLAWNPLARHGSTDKSSSLGSMESLDQPGQTYYEGSLSPIDQAMDQNKRDSAYSSFSASSNTSDSALRPEENSATESNQPGQLLDPRYLQTSSEGGEAAAGAGLHSVATQPASCSRESHCPGSAEATSTAPPQPPVRQDSLRAYNPLPASTHRKDSLHPKGRWSSDTFLSVRGREPEGPSGQLATAGHTKEPLPTDQYYLLSSHTDHYLPMEKEAQSTESLLHEESGGISLDQPCQGTGSQASHEAKPASPNGCPPPWKACWPGALGHHRHSAPEHLLAAQLQALDVSPSQEDPRWTVSPLHREQKSPQAPESWQNQGSPGPAEVPGESSCSPAHSRTGPERPRSASVELGPSLSLHPAGDAGAGGLKSAPSMETLMEGRRDVEGSHLATRKGGPSQHRSAQMRRRSDRFATNLRNEIQWHKAQLQKGKGSAVLLAGEEPVQEAEEPPDSPSALPPPSPPPPAPCPPSPPGMAPGRAIPPRRWGSELSVFAGGSTPHSPSRAAPEPKWKAPVPEPKEPQKALSPPVGGGHGGRWRWSPEHKLQPHSRSLQVAEPGSPSRLPEEESGLLPFADRRKFFEETSKAWSSVHFSRQRGRPVGLPLPRPAEHSTFQPVSSERKDQRRHSVDQSYRPSVSPPAYQDFHTEVPGFYKPLAQCGGDCECWRPLPCSCAAREACAYCGGDRCSTLHQRNVPAAPSSHCAHHCYPRTWSRCGDCCCPAQHKFLEDGGSWRARKTFQADFPVDEWEPPAINRKTSQSMSELAQHKTGFLRVSPFWTCFEDTEREWPPSCRAVSTHNLSWDCERPGRASEASEEGPDEPHKHPLRERAYSESHLCTEELAGTSGRERREAPLAKWEEPLRAAKQKGPPPPRPPPPKWERYRPRRASHSQLLPPRAGLCPLLEDSRALGQSSSEAARQRSQSLPLEQLWDEAGRQPSPRPGEAPSPVEQGTLRCSYFHHGSPHRTPEWPMPDASDRSRSSRPVSSLEEGAIPESPWDKGQNRLARRTPGQTRSSSPTGLPSAEQASVQEGPQGESCPPGMVAPAPPFRLNSEELMRDVAGRDRSLAGVLSPTLGQVTAAELMGSLFSPSEGLAWKGQDWRPQTGGVVLPERQQSQPVSPTCAGAVSPTTCSAYYNMSAGKAELLNKMKELPEGAGASLEEEEELDHNLAQKKVQLIESISRKLGVLQEAQRGLQDDMNANVALGKDVESHVKRVCKPHECEKFRLFIGDLDKVVNLLLSLSGRLARVENALSGLDSDAPAEEEKLALLEKKRQLTAQLEDAKELQEHVARRERLVFASVSRCLPSEQLQDYQHFVRMKSALAIQQRQLDDKIKLGEEQLRCLRESLRRLPREY
ncbi:protein Shroom4 isoform X2 [Rhineura floridana]|nr:protein Shroom4 isoform X2 [Rhineura floridana]